jgi:hypothetical protein
VEAEEGYIKWFYQVFHPRMILPNQEVPVLGGRLGRIRDHMYVVMSSGEVQQGSEA